MLKEIKSLLGIELSAEEVTQEVTEKVEFAQMILENGTVLEAEEFAPEQEVFIVTEEDKIALPVGEYELEDGRILKVEEEGIIADIMAQESEEVEEVEAAEEEEKEEMGYVKKEEFAAAIDEIKAMIDEVKAGMKEKEEMAAEAAKVEEQVKEELSATPAAAPLKHNPEAQVQKEMFNISNKKQGSTRDRVLSKIANLK